MDKDTFNFQVVATILIVCLFSFLLYTGWDTYKAARQLQSRNLNRLQKRLEGLDEPDLDEGELLD